MNQSNQANKTKRRTKFIVCDGFYYCSACIYSTNLLYFFAHKYTGRILFSPKKNINLQKIKKNTQLIINYFNDDTNASMITITNYNNLIKERTPELQILCHRRPVAEIHDATKQ